MKRIRLRAIEPEDLELIYGIENDRSVWNVGITNVPYSRFALNEYIVNAKYDIYTDRQVRLMVDNSEGKTIGIVDITDYDPRHNHAEVGIIIIDECRQQGYATEVLQAVMEYAKNVIHLHKLYAIIDTNNTAALNTFQKAGFTEECVLKDWLRGTDGYEDARLFAVYCD
ncbi:MAG: GNAT family N-acetyltransferase [Prevotella sp.]|nr:GNAT family N-acetyltransferase [Prevotella sp.]